MTGELIGLAKECGFTEAAALDVNTLEPMAMVRDACAEDKCGAYGKNWTCPPACGTLEECGERLRSYKNGILLQTVGVLSKRIDTKGYAETEKRHLEALSLFADRLREQYPEALVLGSGGCRVCAACAYPEPCRFPERSMSSMEAYGLFVSRVCTLNGLGYYYGEKTISYTACVLF